ncbi:uncharacterized protein TrAtP1_001316 [Trichoderma atroviride]|uniref:uncharacterized protein n=1 Tax=Hypocrea atroviridis TaxID=63577 RepID=UPI00332949BA|nr:hypothetical protein TrAtP1_001316 [Trichoderma atroviride]
MDATPDSKFGTITSSLPVKRVERKVVSLPRRLLDARSCLAYGNGTRICSSDMTEDTQRVLCEDVISIAFFKVGVDPDDYPACFEACVDKAINTKLLSTTAWTSWSGHRTLKARMKLAQQFTDSTKQLHCPPAPLIMAAVALKSIRRVEGTGTDETTLLMEQYKTVDMAPTAIHNYVGNEERIIRIMYKLVLPTTEQNENIAESLREVSLDVDSFRSSRHFEPGRRSNVAADHAVKDKETLAVEVTCEMTRDQAEYELKDMLDLLRSKQDAAVTEDMGRRITLAHMKVLAPANKLSIVKWAKAAKDGRLQTGSTSRSMTWTSTPGQRLSRSPSQQHGPTTRHMPSGTRQET